MSGLVNPGGAQRTADPAAATHIGILKDVVRHALVLPADAGVLVQQLACREPGCAPVETVIADLGPPRRTWTFDKATADISVPELRAAIDHHPGGTAHDEHD